MRFMLLCYDDKQAWDEAGEAALHQARVEATQLTYDLHAKGQYLLAAPLEPTAAAKTVRVRAGKSMVTAGPFAETREFLGGFFLIDVADMEEALAVAARHPGARVGSVEVRPLIELPGLPRK